MRIVSLTYVNSFRFTDPMDWINRLYAFTGVLEELSKDHTVFSIEQINYEGERFHEGVHYYFRNYGSKVTRVPFALHRLVKKLKPDIILVRGLNFPLQIIQLRFAVGSKVRIVVENHFDRPPVGIRKFFHRMAYPCVDAYHFISESTAKEWMDAGIIKDKSKCIEVAAGSSRIRSIDKSTAREKVGMSGNSNFLWVGSFSPRKDPITVMTAFEKYLETNPAARLYMIYQTDELLQEVRGMMAANSTLEKAIVLVGTLPNESLGLWYSAADFFVMGSHAEGGSIAMLEALACGCIPVVTAIPSSLAATMNGQYGFHFEAGNADALYRQLLKLENVNTKQMSKEIRDHFQRELSFEAISKKFIESAKPVN